MNKLKSKSTVTDSTGYSVRQSGVYITASPKYIENCI